MTKGVSPQKTTLSLYENIIKKTKIICMKFDKLQMFYSDINRDGKTNVKDVTDLQQTITK